MILQIKHNNETYEINSNDGITISIPVNFNDNRNPKFYDTEEPSKEYYKLENNEYKISAGGGCNVPLINLNIHCSGTHTESANHIISKGNLINELNLNNLMVANLISVSPTDLTNERYHTQYHANDRMITKKILSNKKFNLEFCDIRVLIIRTIPNNKSKTNQNYNKKHHPFMTNDAILYLKEIGVKHILIDTPSIDRFDDKGKLGNHHIFFKDNNIPNKNSITELIYVPNKCKDGIYLIHIGVPKFSLDAAPSCPTIYKLNQI